MIRKKKGIYNGFTKKQLLAMKNLWFGNKKLNSRKVKEKWAQIIGDEKPCEFISRIEILVKTSKEKIKSIYNLEEIDSKNWEYAASDTIVALVRSYLSN